MLLDLSQVVEERGFDSVWVGDSLFSKPRYEPISLLSAISQRTSRVKLGTACMVTSTRNPLYLALEWATLDVISGGRTILGAGKGNPEDGVRREFEALGLDYVKRGSLFEEGLAVIRALWTEGTVDFHGRYFDYDNVSFFSGTELGPLMPIQLPPPIWVVSNPRLKGDAPPDVIERRFEAACRRIVEYGDGWLTCCRAQHPEELGEQLAAIERYADEHEADFSRLVISYQVTMNIGESEEEARTAFDEYISKYYPELSKAMDLSNWGPVGTPKPASTTSSAGSARSTSSVRSSGSQRTCCPCSQPSERGERWQQRSRPAISSRTQRSWSTSVCPWRTGTSSRSSA